MGRERISHRPCASAPPERHSTAAAPSEARGATRCVGLVAAGYNEYGQLGLGDTTHRGSPTDVTDACGGGEVASVSLGSWHSCLICAAGSTLQCWGARAA